MAELNSISDRISSKLSPVLRKLQDVGIKKLGTKCEVLRISPGVPDDWGQSIDDLKDYIISDVFIKRPFSSKTQLFSKENNSLQEMDTTAVDLWDVIPTEVYFPFSGDRDCVPVELKKDDFLVQVLRDEHNSPISIIYQITRIYGRFSVSNLVGRNAECSLYRGTPQPNILNAINLYINSLA